MKLDITGLQRLRWSYRFCFQFTKEGKGRGLASSRRFNSSSSSLPSLKGKWNHGGSGNHDRFDSNFLSASLSGLAVCVVAGFSGDVASLSAPVPVEDRYSDRVDNLPTRNGDAPTLPCRFSATVLRNKPLGPNTRLIRLSLDSPSSRLLYRPGTYVEISGLSFNVDESYPFGKKLSRPYLPVQQLNREGFFDIIVHTYASPRGDMSRYLSCSHEGDVFEVSGPVSRNRVDSKLSGVKRLGIIAGGSGMTAAVQCIRTFVEDEEALEKVELSIICCIKDAGDVFYVKEFEKLRKKYPNQIRIKHTFTRSPPSRWRDFNVGRVSKDMINESMPNSADPDSRIMVCGPDEFVKQLAGPTAKPNQYLEKIDILECGGILGSCGYKSDQIIIL